MENVRKYGLFSFVLSIHRLKLISLGFYPRPIKQGGPSPPEFDAPGYNPGTIRYNSSHRLYPRKNDQNKNKEAHRKKNGSESIRFLLTRFRYIEKCPPRGIVERMTETEFISARRTLRWIVRVIRSTAWTDHLTSFRIEPIVTIGYLANLKS